MPTTGVALSGCPSLFELAFRLAASLFKTSRIHEESDRCSDAAKAFQPAISFGRAEKLQ
jgi:hypothetical protein